MEMILIVRNRINMKKLLLLSVMSVSLVLPSFAQAEGWEYEVELYLLATVISGDTSIGRATGAEVDVDFHDILEKLSMAGMVHFEAHHKSGWGTALDYSFMDLRDDISGPQDGVADFKVRQGVLQADLLYRIPLGTGTFDYLGGIRWWDNDFKVTVDPAILPGSATVSKREDWVDLFVGGRWITPVSERWKFILRGDVGGFGLEADFTASVTVGLKYAMTDSWLLDIGYKGTWVDYETGTKGKPGYFSYDTVTHGPLLGVIYTF